MSASRQSYNRTYVELKLRTPDRDAQLRLRYNRTYVELKYPSRARTALTVRLL